MRHKKGNLIAPPFLSRAPVTAAQSTDAVLTGNVQDATGANVPAVTVTALNVKTGVATVVKTNASGVYLFAALQPGTYNVSAEIAGFRKLTLKDQVLNVGGHVDLNLPMEVGVTTESVEVAANSQAVNTLTASTGGVLNEQKITELPVVTRNAMDLVLTQAGLVSTSSGANINGSRADMTNITLDGVNIVDNFITEALGTTMIWTGTDRIEEVNVVTSPTDAEYGRGSGQVQLVSRSGNNTFHGSVYDYTRNTRLNANSWANNRNGIQRNTLVFNDVVGRLGGPIRKNKTFFFVLFEPQLSRTKVSTTATVPTDTLRQGIYRFFPGVQNANANAATPVVDLAGNPVAPGKATGPLSSVSLFGLDPNRLKADPTGIVAKNLALLPKPNNFITGDGLNTAGYQWRIPEPDDIYSTNLRLDENFSDRHRLTVSYNHDTEDAMNGFAAQPLPTSPAGDYRSTATVGSVVLTSTLRPTLLNEARIGIQRNHVSFISPWDVQTKAILPTLNNVSYILGMGSVTSPISTSSNIDSQGRISPVYEFKDKLSWTRGRHQIKMGLERRYTSSNEFVSFNVVPRVSLGTASAIPTQNITTIPGIGTNGSGAGSMLSMLTGSVSSMTQYFNSPGGANPQFVNGETSNHTWRSGEWTAYVQDDIKLKRNFTLNLGMRWEYYGVPYEAHGKMNGLLGGSSAVFGLSGNSYNALFKPGVMTGSLTQFQLMGKNSPNPGVQPYQPDYNNFAPSIGFAWGIPWLNADKTVLRAGYGFAYERSALVTMSQVYGYNQPGLSNQVSPAITGYTSLSNTSLPLTPTSVPLSTIPVADTNAALLLRIVDNNLRTPYVQNWNVSLGRELARGWVLDVRYVGSKGTKLIRGINVNETNIFENGFLDAYKTTLAGGNAPLFNQLFNGITVSGAGKVDGVNVTGSDAVRKNVTMQTYLYNNDVGGLAYYLASTRDYGSRGTLIRNASLPANFFQANPQFQSASLIGNNSNSIYHSGQVEINKRFGNGLTFQASWVHSKALGDYDGNAQNQIANCPTDRNCKLDRRLLSFDVPDLIRTSGVWSLPFGPKRKILGSSHGVLAKVVEGWETGVIFNKLAGTPTAFSVAAGPADSFNYFSTATPMALGPIPMKSLNVQKVGNNIVGLVGYTQVQDPSVKNMPSNVQALSPLYAVQNPNGQLLLQNPTLGTLGNLNLANVRGLGSFTLNMQLSKAIVVRENLHITLRGDAQNLLNRPIWNNPTLNIDSTSFGLITGAGGTRLIGLSARIEF